MFWPSKEVPLERWFEVWTLPSSTDSKLIDNNPIFFDWQHSILSQLLFFPFVPINQRTCTEMLHNLQNNNLILQYYLTLASTSWLVAHLRIFRLFMKGKFDAYVLWTLDYTANISVVIITMIHLLHIPIVIWS